MCVRCRYNGYLKLEECVAEIVKLKTAMLELDKLDKEW